MKTQKFPADVHARVLVVDDHPTTATTLARAISLLGPGIEAVIASTGEQAFEMVKEHPVDVLITDMIMPGINGLQLVEKLRALPEICPAYIIVITAYEIPDLEKAAQKLSVNDVLLKPVRPDWICQLIASAIAHLTGQAGARPSAPPQNKHASG